MKVRVNDGLKITVEATTFKGMKEWGAVKLVDGEWRANEDMLARFNWLRNLEILKWGYDVPMELPDETL